MKICSKCKLSKPKSDFGKNKSRKDGLQYYCKECSKKKSREYYKNNKEHCQNQVRLTSKARVDINRRKYFDLLNSSKCIDCTENNVATLEFDHIDPKTKFRSVGKMVKEGYSWKKIEEEIKKCEIRCANCHRKKTAIEQNWYKDFI